MRRKRLVQCLVLVLITAFVGLLILNTVLSHDTDKNKNYLISDAMEHGVITDGEAQSSNEPNNSTVPTEVVKPTLAPKPTEIVQPTLTPGPTANITSTELPSPTASEDTKEVKELKLIAVGDNLIHTQVIKSGQKKNGTYNYDHLFENIKPDIEAADIAVINQETILGGKAIGYSGYPRFNSPTEIGDAIVKAGFNVVQHATNHAMDKGEEGLQKTIDYWKKQKSIAVLGVHETKEEQDRITIIEKNGIKIAMLNYTYSLNGLPLPSNRNYMVDMLDEEKVRQDIKRAREEADFVIVFPHWGTEYVFTATKMQRRWTRLFSELGVDLVVGTHPHVIEPVEWIKRDDGHKMLVYYSLGNYVSAQAEYPRMLGGMAEVTIEKREGQRAHIKDASFTPLATHYTKSYEGYGVYKLSEYTDELAENHGLASKGLTKEAFTKLSKEVLSNWYRKE